MPTTRLFNPVTGATTRARVEIVGIGTFPSEPVSDETSTLGLFVFSRAFYDAHRDFASYSVANVDLAAGFDARRNLAPAIAELGQQLQSARTQERATVNDALRWSRPCRSCSGRATAGGPTTRVFGAWA